MLNHASIMLALLDLVVLQLVTSCCLSAMGYTLHAGAGAAAVCCCACFGDRCCVACFFEASCWWRLWLCCVSCAPVLVRSMTSPAHSTQWLIAAAACTLSHQPFSLPPTHSHPTSQVLDDDCAALCPSCASSADPTHLERGRQVFHTLRLHVGDVCCCGAPLLQLAL